MSTASDVIGIPSTLTADVTWSIVRLIYSIQYSIHLLTYSWDEWLLLPDLTTLQEGESFVISVLDARKNGSATEHFSLKVS